MNRSNCEASLQLHRIYLPRRRTGRGFLTGTIFLDTALLITAFVLAVSPFVQKPGIRLDLPVAGQTEGLRPNSMVLSICNKDQFFFNDEPVDPDRLLPALRTGVREKPGAVLILEADRSLPQSTLLSIYDAASEAGFRQVFIATRPAP